jgi:hypothetical protein
MALARYVRGTEIAYGTVGSGSSGDATFTSVGGFTAVVAGQTIYIDGEGQFLIDTVTDANNIELDGVLSQNLAGAHWRVCSDPIAKADIVTITPDNSNNKWVLLWDALLFKVPSV